jgi:hypothetical protein
MTILAHTGRVAGGGEGRNLLVIRNDDGICLGVLVYRRRDGWRFYPAVPAKPSRKGWPTPSQALKSYGIKLTPAP